MAAEAAAASETDAFLAAGGVLGFASLHGDAGLGFVKIMKYLSRKLRTKIMTIGFTN